MPSKLPRRKRGLLLTIGIGGIAAVIAVTVFLLLRPEKEVYVPGAEIEGLTASLARALPDEAPTIRFADVAEEAGIDFRHFSGRRTSQIPEDMGSGAAWGDYDNDGWQDLYVVNIVGPLTMSPEEAAASPSHNKLYHNKGDGTFEEVSAAAGVDLRHWGSAAGWGDYDDDGHVDLFVTAYGENVLFRNDGDGTFSDVTDASGTGGRSAFWAGASWADYNRDGRLDLYVTGYVQYDPAIYGRNGFSNLESRSPQYDIENPASINPMTFDPERNLLYHNDGDGTFTETAVAAGVDNPSGRSLEAAWADFDGDGWQDLYVANDVSDNALYRNLGDGTFEDISHRSRAADYRGAMGLAVGDWDGDLDLDLFITHWVAQENALFSNQLSAGRSPTTESSSGRVPATGSSSGRVPATGSSSVPLPATGSSSTKLSPGALGPGSAPSNGHRRLRAGEPGAPVRFQDVADRHGLGQQSLDFVGWGTAFFDYDNDGNPDLLVVNGSTLQNREQPEMLVPMRDLLYWNGGPERGFFDVSERAGPYFQTEHVGRGAAFADYDNDGDVDVFVVNHGGRGVLLNNAGHSSNHWLEVSLKGTRSTTRGIGARIRVVAGGRVFLQEVGTQPSYLSQNSPVSHFGLGNAAVVDTLEVRWPRGPVTVLADLPADRLYSVVEGQVDP